MQHQKKKKKKKKTAKKPTIWFWFHWFVKPTPTSAKNQFTKLCPLTSETIKEGAKIICKKPYLIWRYFLSKNDQSIKEKLQKGLCLAEHTPKSAKQQFTRLCWMISGAIREGAKINFELPHLFRRQVWIKNQKTLSKREKLQKCLKFDSGCTV